MDALLRRVVVATDFGVEADDALDRALRLPWAAPGELCIVHVAGKGARESAAARLRREAIGAAARAGSGVAIRARLELGDVAGAIGAFAEAWAADLIVIGARRSPALRHLLGRSTARRLVDRTAVPVLVVHRCPSRPYARPLVAIDLSDASERLLPQTARLVERGTPVHVLHVVEEPVGRFVSTSHATDPQRAALRARASAAVQRLVDRSSRALGLVVQSMVECGEPEVVLAAEIERDHPDLIVLGTHGRSWLARAFSTSVTDALLGPRARCDVLAVAP